MTDQPSEAPRSRVAILGCAHTTRGLAPFDDLSWEIWTHGAYSNGDEVAKALPRWDKWFESHDPRKVTPNIDCHMQWLAEQTKPVVVWTPMPPLSDKIVFDWQSLVDRFGTEFFTSTTAWMFAHAIVEDFKEIGLYGIEMATDEEWAYQRAGVKHFQYIAEQYHGITVTVPPISEMSRERMPYPFANETPMAKLIFEMDTKANQHIDILNKEIATYHEALHKCEGGRSVINRFKRYYTFG